MSFHEWFSGLFSKGRLKLSPNEYSSGEIRELTQEIAIRELALWSAVNLIANGVGKCEFKTFSGGREIKGPEYYLWNYEPNQNQNSTQFLHKLIATALVDNEALVVEYRDRLYIADSFTKAGYAFKEDEFTDVWINELQLHRKYLHSEVLHIQINHINMRSVLNALYSSYEKLISSAKADYQWKAGRHGIMKLAGMQSGNKDWQEQYNEVLNNYVKGFLTSPNAVLPQFAGFEYEELSGSTRVQNTTRDIRSLMDDIFDFTANAINVPAALLKRTVEGTRDAVTDFLTFTIDPICEQIGEEATRKRYGLEGFLRGDYMLVSSRTIKHFDLFGNAPNVDKLISSGSYSINEVRAAAGDTKIDKEWADEHYITKNYTKATAAESTGGGEGK